MRAVTLNRKLLRDVYATTFSLIGLGRRAPYAIPVPRLIPVQSVTKVKPQSPLPPALQGKEYK